MTSFIENPKMTDRSVVAACSLGGSLRGTGLPVFGRPGSASVCLESGSVSLPVGLPIRERSERPAEALAVAAAAQVQAYAFAIDANGAETKQAQQHHTMWAFRGPEPWSHPA